MKDRISRAAAWIAGLQSGEGAVYLERDFSSPCKGWWPCGLSHQGRLLAYHDWRLRLFCRSPRDILESGRYPEGQVVYLNNNAADSCGKTYAK